MSTDPDSPTIEIAATAAPPAADPLSETSARADRLLATFDSLRRELESLNEAAEAHERRAAELEARDQGLRDHASQLTEREFHLAERHRELNEAQERLVAEASQWKDRESALREREEAVARREAGLADGASRIAELESALAERDRLAADALQRHEELDRQHAERTAAIDGRESDLARREAELASMREALEARALRMAEAESTLNEARHALAAAETALAQREAALVERESSPDQPPQSPQPEDHLIALRRARLKKQRALLAERADQLIRAKEALAQRLADTARLRAMQTPPDNTTPVAPAAPARAGSWSGSMVRFAAGAAVMFSAIACTAWWIAGLIDRPQHAASIALAMEEGGEPPSDEEADSWGRFHAELLRDPQLLERAAENLKRRGFADLSTPSDLKRFVDDRLITETPQRGEMVLTLTSEGRVRTQRILETYCAAVIAMANDSRERRMDGRATMVRRPAAADETPVRDGRLPLFGVTAGIMSLACIGVGLAGASMTRRLKNKAAARDADGGEERWSIGGR